MNTSPTNTNKIDFLFARPPEVDRLSHSLNVMLAMGSIASRMVQEERTRTIHPDGRSENVAEHSYMLAKVATAVASEQYPWLDRGGVALRAIVHDDPEAYAGDTPTDSIAKHNPDEKAWREHLATRQLSFEYGDIIPAYVDDVVTYEAQGLEDYESQFVRILDKFMVLLIHIPNGGETLRANYSYDQFIADARDVEKRLLNQYPQWIELIESRTALAQYIADTFLK